MRSNPPLPPLTRKVQLFDRGLFSKSLFNRTLMLSCALFLPTQLTLAEETSKTKTWETDAEIGWLLTGGNTDTQSLNIKLSTTKKAGNKEYSARAETLRSEENEIETASKVLAEGGWKWRPSPKHFMFINLLQEDDAFSEFDFQTTLAVGYGKPLIDTDTKKLEVSLGPGARYSKFKGTVDGEESDTEGLFRVGAHFKAKLSESAEFTQNITVDAGDEQTISKSETALKAQVAGELAMKASLIIRNNSEPLPGDAATDRETAVTLVYSF